MLTEVLIMIKELIKERNLPDIPKDREAIKQILQEHIYGYMPSAPDKVEYSEPETVENRYPQADVKRVKITVSVSGKSFTFPIITAIHRDMAPHPFFVLNNFRPDFPDMYLPAEEILDNGFNLISFCYKDVTSDDNDFTNGLADLFVGEKHREASQCGKIILWAWAAMRVMDYVCTLPQMDLNNAGIVGHSRLGKTALVTAMFDTRFKYVFSNNAGCCGDAIIRGKKGETFADITKNFPYWFCENLKKYVGNQENAPFDQHFLLASICPRFVYVASSSLDLWADPLSQYLTCAAVSDYFENAGVKGFVHPDRLPNIPESFHGGHIGYHIKDGDHFLARRDWLEFMKFFKLHLGE